MADVNLEAMRSGDCSRAFRTLAWGFVFLFPLAVTLRRPDVRIELLPDAAGWLIFLLALRRLRELHPRVRRLKTVALFALILCVLKVFWPLTSEPSWQRSLLVVQALAMAVGAAFVWDLCGLAAGMGRSAAIGSVAWRATLLRWVYVLAVVLLACLPLAGRLKGPAPLAVAGGTLLFYAITLSLMMGLMASVASLCRHLSGAAGPPADESRQGPA